MTRTLDDELKLLTAMKPKWGDPPSPYALVRTVGRWVNGRENSHYIHRGEDRVRCNIDPGIVLGALGPLLPICQYCIREGAPRD